MTKKAQINLVTNAILLKQAGILEDLQASAGSAVGKVKDFAQNNPFGGAAVGAGAGSLGGLLLALLRGKGYGKSMLGGATLGAGVGAGMQYKDEISKLMQKLTGGSDEPMGPPAPPPML